MADRPTLRSAAIARALHGAFCRGVTSDELLRLGAAKVHAAGPPYDAVWIFSASRAAASGHATSLAAGESALRARDQAKLERVNVYLPRLRLVREAGADPATGSLLVVLIRRHNQLLGEIQIVAERPDGFSEVEQVAAGEVADALAALL